MVKEKPRMLIVGTEAAERQRLRAAAREIEFEVEEIDGFEGCPPRSELDPDLVVTTSELEGEAILDIFPPSFRSRWVCLVSSDGWGFVRQVGDVQAISASASVEELAYRLPAALEQIRREVWTRLGLPHAGGYGEVWSLLPAMDWVTGLDNRLRFLQELQTNISRSQRYQRPFCCILVRLDNYATLLEAPGGQERVNVTLEEAAGVLGVSIRDADFLARMHNDLFGLLLPETDLESARHVVSRIENNLSQFPFSQSWLERPRFSCGISAFDHQTSNVDALLAEAQRSLEISEAV